MKKTFYTFLVTLCLSANLYGQITIDSMVVYQTPATDSTSCFVDSISINGTHTGQVLKKIEVGSPLLDAQATTVIVLTFEGCDSMNTTIYDTTVTVDAFTGRFVIFSNWDTTTNCSYPVELFTTDTLVSYSCLPSNTNKLINEKQVEVYPNPAQDVLNIEYSEVIRPRKIQLMNINGAIVKNFEPTERLLDVHTLSSGIFFLVIETQDGYFIRKKVVIQ